VTPPRGIVAVARGSEATPLDEPLLPCWVHCGTWTRHVLERGNRYTCKVCNGGRVWGSP
jgi:hypothetical protein